jgi:hypothetical protein
VCLCGFRQTDTETHLKQTVGLGDQMVDRFFRPFYQGIFLAPLAEQSSRMFMFVFQMFASDGISLPKAGLGALPKQLASKLPKGACVRSSRVGWWWRARPGPSMSRTCTYRHARALACVCSRCVCVGGWEQGACGSTRGLCRWSRGGWCVTRA